EDEIHLTRRECRDRCRRRLVRHVEHLDAGSRFQKLTCQEGGGGGAAIGVLAWLLLRRRNELPDGLEWRAGAEVESRVILGDGGKRNEVAQHVEWLVRNHQWIQNRGRTAHHEQR